MRSHVTKHLMTKNPVERKLFHGTSEEDVHKICSFGFDRGFAGKNGEKRKRFAIVVKTLLDVDLFSM